MIIILYKKKYLNGNYDDEYNKIFKKIELTNQFSCLCLILIIHNNIIHNNTILI